MNIKLPKVELYSDGWARPNPGPWGYGVILRLWKKEKEFSGFEEHTTNNRMELTWVIVWLSKLKEKCHVEVFTDSSYVVNSVEKGWALKWQKNNWMRTKTEKAVNYDLWEKLLNIVEKHEVKFNWVRGHNGHEENERCDTLATNEILKKIWKLDEKSLNKTEILKKVLNSNIDNEQKKIKIQKAWDKCRKCATPVTKMTPKKKNTKNKSYYYEYYLTCENCKTNYFIDEAKVMINKLDI
jgi:ribonuclease HI